MAEDAWQPLAKRIARGDMAGVVALLEALDEPARKRLSTQAKKAATEAGWNRTARYEAAHAAQFGTGGAVAAVRQWWIPNDRRTNALRERLVRCRPRAWRQEWAERTCSRDIGWAWNDWKVVHRMVKDGVIDRPEADGYVTGAVTALPDWRSGRTPEGRALADILRREPEWLERDLWQLFAIEATGLTTADTSVPMMWQTALVTLAADGVVSRERLLDESLGALRRDFAPHHARWYQRLFAALEPSTDELEARVDDLLALLAADNPANLALALRALAELERAKRLPAGAFLGAVGPALVAPAKVHATRAAKLAGRILRRAPEHARAAAPVLLDALAHEARELQSAVLDILERHAGAFGEPERAQLASVAETLDPALRPRAAALLGEPSRAAGARPHGEPAAAVVIPGRRQHDFGAPRLRPDDLLVPICDVDDLLDRAATALERGDDPDEIELVLDAISRLRELRPDPARANALTERATELHFSWQAAHHLTHARDAVAMALLRWLRPRANATIASVGSSPVDAIAQRLRELLADLARPQPRALLAAPTHRGGWVDAAEAVRRVSALGGARPPVMDLAQLVLRIAPDGRAEALRDAAGLGGEAAGVLAHALGGDARRPLLARLGPAWDAARDARDPAAFVVPEPDFNDLAPLLAQWRPTRLRASVAAQSPASLALLEEAWWGLEANGLERWLTRVWPARRDGAYVVVCRRLWMNTGTREHGIGDVLELLLDPAEPLAGHGALAVALGLGAADATDRTLAADIAIAALRDRRLDGATLGILLARIMRDQIVQPSSARTWRGEAVPPTRAVPSRWATALADVAGAGPLHAHDVQAAIETLLASAAEDDRRRLIVLVELLRRLAVDAGAAIRSPGARTWLEATAPRSKAGRAAREALAVSGDGAARSRAAVAELAAGAL
ncbi:MAG: hypothetical protein QOJ89_812 [bacterium]